MSDLLNTSIAESKILAYKLDKIRKYVEERIPYVDPIVKTELNVISDMIRKYEYVPNGWELTKPLVEIKENEV